MHKSPDQTWLLLGASGGIGRAVLDGLLESGARVLVAGRQPQRLTGQYREARLVPVTLDLESPQLGAALRELVANEGLPDGVIHCAGINHFQAVDANHDASLDAMLNVNLRSAMVLARELTPAMRRRGSGTLVFVGSTFGSIGFPGYSAYCATKFGLRGFVEALRRELADSPLVIRYVAPRATRTAMNDASVNAMNDDLGNHMDSPGVVASAILRAIEGRRASVYLGWPERLFVRLNALLPWLVDKALRKQLPVIQRYMHKGVQP
ncbi:short chain dehydrogenase [Alcanivorax hongdengensis A-11-3]|uniref:Short chain dehydrogenase n=1 Tax=Alcanivorax hongdengensis A-11-3 TaxID=1177179 RepID=L0WA16_9GAMM|nr:SDR family oxidoreductase [Alcanivorax hongdengensis]EKF73844.1 short chain dehydrogenase [Alcanivorax hongdengensis A-11-3]